MSLTRRRFLRDTGTVLGGLGAGSWAYGQNEVREATRTVSILHTTDLHGHILPTSAYDGTPDLGGLARCATQIRRWKEENPYSILVDVGDVYQGTPVGWMTRGRLMIDLFNKMGYDAWVMGNHEFDWGPEVVIDAVGRSNMPVMTANVRLDGTLAGGFEDQAHPLAKVKPHVIRVIGGFKIGLVGLITPGLPYWLPRELRKGFAAVDPVEVLRAQVKELREENQVDAVIVCGHMGWRGRDDFANPVNALLEGGEGVDVYIAGHTHRNHPSRELGQVLYTQADYFGIHCGRVDLVFDLESRRLVAKQAQTVLMDASVSGDPLVLEASAQNLDEAQVYLDREIGELEGSLSSDQPSPGEGSQIQKLLCAAFEWHARQQEVAIDGVFHGTFSRDEVESGTKTVADAWELVPYDNNMVVLELTRAELVGVLNESLEGGGDRALFGFEVAVEENEPGKGQSRGGKFVTSLRSLRRPDAPADTKYAILFNSYDAQSGGKRLMRLRSLAQRAGQKRTTLTLSSREALIEYFLAQKTVRRRDLEKAG